MAPGLPGASTWLSAVLVRAKSDAAGVALH